jgi:hypothetical protein
MHSVLQGH